MGETTDLECVELGIFIEIQTISHPVPGSLILRYQVHDE